MDKPRKRQNHAAEGNVVSKDRKVQEDTPDNVLSRSGDHNRPQRHPVAGLRSSGWRHLVSCPVGVQISVVQQQEQVLRCKLEISAAAQRHLPSRHLQRALLSSLAEARWDNNLRRDSPSIWILDRCNRSTCNEISQNYFLF